MPVSGLVKDSCVSLVSEEISNEMFGMHPECLGCGHGSPTLTLLTPPWIYEI